MSEERMHGDVVGMGMAEQEIALLQQETAALRQEIERLQHTVEEQRATITYLEGLRHE